MSAITTERDGFRVLDVKGNGFPNGGPYVQSADNEPERATFGAGVSGFTLGTAPTDILTIQGAVGKVVRIKSIIINGNSGTTAAYPLLLIRRSSANTAGTSTAVTPTAHDTLDGSSAATVRYYTANASSLGTSVGTMHVGRLVAANAANLDRLALQYSWQNDKAIILRGASDYLVLNMNGASLSATTTLDIDLLWTEE